MLCGGEYAVNTAHECALLVYDQYAYALGNAPPSLTTTNSNLPFEMTMQIPRMVLPMHGLLYCLHMQYQMSLLTTWTSVCNMKAVMVDNIILKKKIKLFCLRLLCLFRKKENKAMIKVHQGNTPPSFTSTNSKSAFWNDHTNSKDGFANGWIIILLANAIPDVFTYHLNEYFPLWRLWWLTRTYHEKENKTVLSEAIVLV